MSAMNRGEYPSMAMVSDDFVFRNHQIVDMTMTSQSCCISTMLYAMVTAINYILLTNSFIYSIS